MSAINPSKPSSSYDYKIDVVMNHDHTITANFWTACNLAIQINGPGTVSIQKVQGLAEGLDASRFIGDITQDSFSNAYYEYEYVTFTVIPDPGATFTGWTSAGDVSQIDPQKLSEIPTATYTGSMTIPLDPMSQDVTLYMSSDVNLTANFH